MAKQIDPVDIKNAIKNGQLEVIMQEDRSLFYELTTYSIYIRDTENDDTVLIARLGVSEVD